MDHQEGNGNFVLALWGHKVAQVDNSPSEIDHDFSSSQVFDG